MAHRGLNLLLAAPFVLTSTPHALCMCPHMPANSRTARPMCPHCRVKHPTPANQPDRPCQCGACEEMHAVPPGGAVQPAALTHAPLFHVAPDLAAMTAVVETCHLPEKGWAVEPPGSPTGAGRALTIFLGHLLF
jgi:hypothetical protein